MGLGAQLSVIISKNLMSEGLFAPLMGRGLPGRGSLPNRPRLLK